MNLYIGIDGGGTKTKISIINDSEELLFQYTSGPSSIDTVTLEKSFINISDNLNHYFIHHHNLNIKCIFAGLGGIVSDADKNNISNLLRQLPNVTADTIILARNDMENALYSGLTFNYGMTLICGTGMVSFGKNDQLSYKCGGWGYKEGERGSGYHLGYEAIQYAIRALDGRLKSTDFTNEILATMSLSQTDDIVNVINKYYDNRTLTASLAPIVTKYANLNDSYAKKICDFATDECVLAIKAVYDKLQFEETVLTIVGSLGNSVGYFSNRLHQKINELRRNIVISSPKVDPSLAAALYALNYSNNNKSI